jgi:retinol dehydrogenase 12
MQRTSIITGAYGAIGKAIAEGIAQKGYQTVLVGRDESKLRELAEELKEKTDNPHISYKAVDLSSKAYIEAFAKSWEGPLHVLINNAAVTPRARLETPEGIEMQWATNVLGYVWMTQSFTPYMENLEDARVINVASNYAGGLDIEDPEFKKRPYDNDSAYRQSKQANRMLTVAFAERLKSKNITVLSNHPGDVNSKLSNNLGFGGTSSPEKGAATPLFCALDPSLKGVTGKFLENKSIHECRFSSDKEKVERLYRMVTAF